jgi:cellulose synthase/poly-beta-1,6-N-acetylglucosamine synthase-like glycosyltransferase
VSVMSLERAAVVVPAHGDPEGLARLLMTVAAVEWPRDKLRVCVGIDGPDPAVEKVVRDAGVDAAVLETNRGSYAARNAALDVVLEGCDFVAFTDSDCLVSPQWLMAHAAALQRAPLSGGAIDVTLRQRPSAAEFVDRHRHLRQEAYVTTQGYAATANLAVRREVLEQMRFDESLRSGGDAEFCLRAGAAGHALHYTPDAVVEHPARRTSRAVMKKIRRICSGIRGNPGRWQHAATPPLSTTLHVPRLAYHQGLTKSPWWMWRAWWLEYRASRAIRRTVSQVKRERGWQP